MALSRDEILGAPDMEPVAEDVPEWGGEVLIRRFTAGEALKMEDASGIDIMAAALVDEDGVGLFTTDDVRALEGKSAVAVNRVLQRVLKVNGLSSEGN
jgi:hypothetical protein